MAGSVEAVASLLLYALVLKVLLAAMLGGLYEWRSWRWLVARVRPPVPPPRARGLQEVSADARRISLRYHQDGLAHVQLEGRGQSFDRVLGEAAGLLGLQHLLGVLPAGPERDVERKRLEARLAEHGVLDAHPAG